VSSFDTTASRFLRPTDVGRIRRNQRQIQFRRFFAIARGVVLIGVIAGGGVWAWRQTQSDDRFAIRHVEVAGAKNTPKAQLDALMSAYIGANLFQVDIAQVQQELGNVRWVNRIEIEKRLPDTLRIHIVERKPVALVGGAAGLDYVDENGVAFAPLSPAVGSADLPLIMEASGDELRRCVLMLQTLKKDDPVLYSRMSEVRPIAPRGFAIYDRELGATVYVNSDDIVAKWRGLYAIVAAEGYGANSLQYADLRFADRIVVRPHNAVTQARMAAASAAAARSQEITN
jgi:cell division protein FtsQ